MKLPTAGDVVVVVAVVVNAVALGFFLPIHVGDGGAGGGGLR